MRYGEKLENAVWPNVAKYRLSKLAEADLLEIAIYGDEQFGEEQSDRYREQLKQRFLLLAEQPYLFPAVDDIREGYRRSVCGVHSIYYRLDVESVEIMHIVGRQDLKSKI